jgi:superfamily II DNA or RNA helicase
MTVQPIQTDFRSRYNGQQYTRIIQELVKDEDRNALIAKVTVDEIRKGNSVLVLSRQIKHLENIYDHIALAFDFDQGWMQHVEVVTGQVQRGKRDKFIHDLREGNIRCILGTQIFEEGVDIPRLNRIVLAFPGTEITALQKVGRGSRAAEGKTEAIVYDLLDDLVRVLAKQYLRRKSWYKSVGINIEKVRAKDAKHKGKGKQGKGQGGSGQGHAVRRAQVEAGRVGRRVLRVARPRR